MSTRRSCWLALVVLVGGEAGLAFGQDLVALAKKEKERRAKIAKSAPAYTDGEGAAKPTGGSVTALPGATTSTQAAGTTAPDQGKADWKSRADAARAAITTAQANLDAKERELAEFSSDTKMPSAAEIQDPMRLQKREQHTKDLIAQIATLKTLLANARTALAALETEARKQGIPAGWLR